MAKDKTPEPELRCKECDGLHYGTPKGWCPLSKTCQICHEPSELACSDCAIDTGAVVYICGKEVCRSRHEQIHKKPDKTLGEVCALAFRSAGVRRLISSSEPRGWEAAALAVVNAARPEIEKPWRELVQWWIAQCTDNVGTYTKDEFDKVLQDWLTRAKALLENKK